jgi:hypothetical protein
MLHNATFLGEPGGGPRGRSGRQYLAEYIERGWIAENRVENPTVKTEEDEAKAAVSKTMVFLYRMMI